MTVLQKYPYKEHIGGVLEQSFKFKVSLTVSLFLLTHYWGYTLAGFANTALRRTGEERQEFPPCGRCAYPDLDGPEDCSRARREIRRAVKKHSEDCHRGAGQNKGLSKALLQSKLALLLTLLFWILACTVYFCFGGRCN